MKFRPTLAVALALLLLSAGGRSWAQAAPAGAPPLDGAIESEVRQIALAGTRSNAAGAPRVEITVGQLDPRLRLAPCQHVDAYVPEGTRLWGKSRVGLRCTQGTVKWNVYMPITVQVFGQALVSTGSLAAGAILTSADVALAEVDLAEDPSAAVARPDMAIGRALARPLRPGQSLRASDVRARQWFAAGETVTVMAVGEGFSVAGEGQALNNGVEGQPVRVKTEGGRIVTGQPVGDRRVEMPL